MSGRRPVYTDWRSTIGRDIKRVAGPNPFFRHVVVLALMGIGWIVLGRDQWTRMEDFVATAVHANGRIIRLQERPSPDGGPMHCPVVEFTAATGETRQFESNTCSDVFFSDGDDVDVLYSKAEPTRAEIKSFLTIWLGPTIWYVAGATCIGMALVFYWGTTRYRG